MESGTSINFEARLLQQEYATNQSIKEQLNGNNFYQLCRNGNYEHDSIVRLQNVILSKVQKKDGTPVKFLRIDNNAVNIVVIHVSDLILGTIDLYDCLLATHGDPYVEAIHRRGIFGLFQESSASYPEKIKDIAKSYEHTRNTLHGVLFLFTTNNSRLLDYNLEQYMIWNPQLVDQNLAEKVNGEITQAIPIRRNKT